MLASIVALGELFAIPMFREDPRVERAPPSPAAVTILPSATASRDPSLSPPSPPPSIRLPSLPSSPLYSSDPFIVLEAADALAARRAVGAIPDLAAIDIRSQPESAPSVIDALGRLAGHADAPPRAVAVDRLLGLLGQEKQREAADAPGNVLSIYEALGHTQDARAAAALERELVDPSVSFAAKTIVVDSLARLAMPSSKAVVERVLAEVEATQAAGIEDEIRRDLVRVASEALARWPT